MLRRPPDILITTPESLFLLLTSQGREMLRAVRTLILDEVHAVAGTKRGAHLALSVERLDRLVGEPVQRVGLSATQRPLEEIGRFVSGGTADPARRRRPPEGARPSSRRSGRRHARARGRRADRPVARHRRRGDAVDLDLALDLPRAPSPRRGAPVDDRLREQPAARRAARAASERARGEGGRARAPRLARPRAAGRDRGAAQARRDPVSRRHLVARARDRHGRGRSRHPGREPEVGRARPPAHRPRRARARRRLEGADLSEVPRRPARVGGRRRADARRRDRGDRDPAQPARRARPAGRRDLRRRGDRRRRPARPRAGRVPVRRPLACPARERARHALRAATPRTSSPSCKPRIVWDRTGGTIRGRDGARRLAVTNAGTIPDRGLFGVHLVDGGGRVGELDEEMVYEARAGQTFLLGASTWRIEEITRDRVLVSPAPGVPGAVPFWKGEGVGRPYELGEQIGTRLARARRAFGAEGARPAAPTGTCLDERAASQPPTFLREQEAATGAVPSDRTVVVERFRDEIGDWRVCILTPFGARVHAPWAMAVGARLRDALGLEAQSIWSDDGIAFHLPDADAPPPTEELLVDPDELDDLVVAGGGADGALRLPLPRERRPRAADPAPPSGRANAALAAATEGAVAASGRAPVSGLSDHARDLPRVPPGRLRPARAEAAAAGSAFAADRRGRRRDSVGFAVLGVAALRLRRHVHVRGRHAARRAAGPGPVARPRPSPRATRSGGAARPDRSGCARGRRGSAARRSTYSGRSA